MNKLVFTVLLSLVCLSSTLGQSAREREADSLAVIAMKLMDNGEIDRSIALLNESKKLYKKWSYDYEIGLALYMKNDFTGAQKVFEKLVRSNGSDALQYKMLGNTYSRLGDRDKARKMYHKGLKKFPNSGKLYLELGIVEQADENYNAALNYWETGIAKDPHHASNYYWAAKYFTATKEPVWSLLYGEIFLNLEFNTPRADEISALLYKVYNDVYVFESDTSGSFNLTESGHQITITMDQLEEAMKSPEKIKNLIRLPFAGVYSLSIAPGALHYTDKGISLKGLNNLRAGFIDFWMNEENNRQLEYPYVLFPYHAKMMEQGLFVYYNYFLMRHGNIEEYDEFFKENETGFNRFFDWYNLNHLPFDGNLHSRFQM
jgi:tetratricopeptide (TPR) repeat protein